MGLQYTLPNLLQKMDISDRTSQAYDYVYLTQSSNSGISVESIIFKREEEKEY